VGANPAATPTMAAMTSNILRQNIDSSFLGEYYPQSDTFRWSRPDGRAANLVSPPLRELNKSSPTFCLLSRGIAAFDRFGSLERKKRVGNPERRA
jgi:hypothetical protein